MSWTGEIKSLFVFGLIIMADCSQSCTKVIRINETPPSGEFSLRKTVIEILQTNFDSAVYKDDIGYPHVDFMKLQTLRQKEIFKKYNAIIIENKYIKFTLLPDVGKPYSLIYKVTGHEEFFIPGIAQLLHSSNKLGWWFILGGVEYTMPDEEHGETWAAQWKWEVVEDSDQKKTISMSVDERRFGLKEIIDISVFPDKAYYEASISITNPTDSTVKFQHWINPMWVPGGDKNGLTPNTEFIMPTKEVYATERTFNDWMLTYDPKDNRLQPYDNNPMRLFKNWVSHGDLLAWKLEIWLL